MSFNDDGSKFYEAGSEFDDISQFELSTPFDLGTATFEKVGPSGFAAAGSITFDNNGSRMYVSEDFPDEIQQYSLNTTTFTVWETI
jgi:hypothetical protein